jgi:hypothetical protein
MGRFILRYRGAGPKPAEDVDRIHHWPHLRVLDDSSPRMLLVEGSPSDLEALVGSLPDWMVSQERTYRVPDPHPVPRRSDE